ncbi:hypothetical protein [Bdellovibrio bacteriovorus]|uniref:hypothetical protein n=1 Tax=Bdellovibrio bacteriovorus TaxID=959 RepID=UPI0035A5C2C4
MKFFLQFLACFFVASLSYAEEVVEISTNQLYAAVEDLALYIQEKDGNFAASFVYRDILERSSELGWTAGVAGPANELLKYENNQKQRTRLQRIANLLSGDSESQRKEQTGPGKKRWEVVANSDNACVGQCIRDIISTGASGATMGGLAGGPAGAIGGGIIGASLGGVACSTSRECNKDDKKEDNKTEDKFRVPRDFDIRSNEQIQDKIQKKRDIVVNPG